eukprot:5728323-Prymnesium_polylepis.1
MLVGRGSEGATGRAKRAGRVKHFCSGKTILVESAKSDLIIVARWRVGRFGRVGRVGPVSLSTRISRR